MRTVRLTRAHWLNDRSAGDAGDIRYLEDGEARDLVEVHQLAVYADDGPSQQEPPHAIEVVRIEPEGVTQEFREQAAEFMDRNDELLQGLADSPHERWEDAAEPGDVELMKQPWTTAPKADWVKWAVQNGCSPKQAEVMTKNGLMSRYGERL